MILFFLLSFFFPDQHPPSDSIVPDLIVSSVGALDLGGASTQISFIPNHTQTVPKDFHFDLSLYGHNYSLYTHSFLCYGVNEATLRLQAILVEVGIWHPRPLCGNLKERQHCIWCLKALRVILEQGGLCGSFLSLRML